MILTKATELRNKQAMQFDLGVNLKPSQIKPCKLSQHEFTKYVFLPAIMIQCLIKQAERLRVRMYDSAIDFKKENRLLFNPIIDYQSRISQHIPQEARGCIEFEANRLWQELRPKLDDLQMKMGRDFKKYVSNIYDLRVAEFSECTRFLSILANVIDRECYEKIAKDGNYPKPWVQEPMIDLIKKATNTITSIATKDSTTNKNTDEKEIDSLSVWFKEISQFCWNFKISRK